MKVSIVVPAYNEEKILGRCLDAIRSACAAFTALKWDWEIIVCNNNSTDRTAEIAESAGAIVVFEPVNQIARARNTGASASSGDWLIFVDADSFPPRDLFARVAEEIKTGRALGGGCLVQLDEVVGFAKAIMPIWNFISTSMRWAAGSFIFCDAKTFRELNGFSLRLYASEEVDFSRRLKRAAKRARRKVVIIRHPRLVTSARKMHLYKPGEYLRFIIKAALFPRKVLGNREECIPWYDGRR